MFQRHVHIDKQGFAPILTGDDIDDQEHHTSRELINDHVMAEAFRHAQIPLCISDPTLPENSIVFANDAFFELTGYSDVDVIGKNCRVLQGRDTTPESIDTIRRIIAQKRVDTVEIINYRKDGSSFINAL